MTLKPFTCIIRIVAEPRGSTLAHAPLFAAMIGANDEARSIVCIEVESWF